jgi:two-component system, chemotaxis family, chemotaxis protein CheY
MILVVDDSRAMRMIVLRELRKAGYETRDVAEAENGLSALEKIRQGGVDLVLSDWNMPEMSGIALLRSLRKEGNNIPFGLVTSESTPLMHRDALDAGADFVVTKPFSADSLSVQVERVMQGLRQADGIGAAVAQEEVTLSGILEDLLGRKVVVSQASPPRLPVAGAVARYRSASEARRILAVGELTLAASLGAALSRMPLGAAEEAVEEGNLPELLERNMYEVFNILSKVVPDREELWHLEGMKVLPRLQEHAEVSQAMPISWSGAVEVKVDGYLSGRLAFLRI